MNVKTFKFNDCNLNTNCSKTSKKYAEQKENSQLWESSVKNMGHGKASHKRVTGCQDIQIRQVMERICTDPAWSRAQVITKEQ
jgi:hypothetical protein